MLLVCELRNAFSPSCPCFSIPFLSSTLPPAALGTSGKQVRGSPVFLGVIVLCFLMLPLVFGWVSRLVSAMPQQPDAAVSSFRQAKCSIPYSISAVLSMSLCLFSLSPGPAACLHHHHIITAVCLVLKPSPSRLLAVFNE